MFVWTILAVLGLPGCFYIGKDLHERELDDDQDQVGWPDDCDPDDPLASVRQDWYADADGDGFGDPDTVLEACGQPVGFVADSTDCDDQRVDANPDGVERCDGAGVDEDCDGLVDDADEAPEGQFTFYADTDGDGFGDPSAIIMACVQPSDAVQVAGDCDDTNSAVSPAGIEVCGGGDEDCDGVSDDNDASVTGTTSYWVDADGDGYGDPAERVFRCVLTSGLVTDDTDCDDDAAGVNPGATETCDPAQVDEDCDGEVNESGQTIPYWQDADSDGYGDVAVTVDACAQPDGFVPDSTDCNDANAGINPGATEVCDPADVDENCNGVSDDNENGPLIGPNYHPDVDLDGFGDAATPPVVYCDTVPPGLVPDGSDCDDSRDVVNPTAAEVCDAIDNDCDGLVDDADGNVSGRTEWFPDTDADGFGAGIASFVLACVAPSGHVSDATDCNDADMLVNPGATEVCDGVDNDCDGAADDADPQGPSGTTTYYLDNDGDGFGAAPVQACDVPAGAVADGTDCDDTDILIRPGGVEVCGGADEDCDGQTDESGAAGSNTLYLDSDSDGYGDPTMTLLTCAGSAAGHVATGDDCNDASGAINPGATETCAPGDEDCDGLVNDDDDNVAGTSTFYQDADNDTFGGDIAISACVAPAGFVTNSTDCNDGQNSVNPNGTEVCDPNDLDEDCNGVSDDDDSGVLAASELPYYADADGDGYGAATLAGFACSPPAGFAATNTDCDDIDPTSNPGFTEFCDPADADNDCDGLADDADLQGATGQVLYFVDADGDGFGDENDLGTLLCDPLAGEELNNLDCDDSNSSRNPGETEFNGDGLDSNCDLLDDLCGGGHFLVPSGPWPTITAALAASCPGDEVEIEPGTYTENLDLRGLDVILDASQVVRPVIDGQNNGPVVILDGDSDLDDLIVRNGNGVDGGCVQVIGGDGVAMTQVGFENCTTTGNGGALHVDAASTDVDCYQCTVDGATATGDGGAFYADGLLFIDEATITNSIAGGNGGAFATGPNGFTLFADSTFTGNMATNGGAISCDGCDHLDMYRSTLSGNTATGNGGAIWVDSPVNDHGDVDDNQIVGNTAGGDGGGVYYSNTGFWDSDFDTNTFDGNIAGGNGGGLYLFSVYGTDLDDLVFTNNQAVDGSAIYADDVIMDWDNTTADTNTATSGSAIVSVNALTDIRAIDGLVMTGNIGPAEALYVESVAGQMDSIRIELTNPASGGNARFVGENDVYNLLAYGPTTDSSVVFATGTSETTALTNATIADTPGQSGLVVELGVGTSMTVTNTTITGTGTGVDNTIGGVVPAFGFCNVNGNTTDFDGLADPGGTNISVAPGFVGGTDYRLAGGSLLIDAGDPAILDPDLSNSDIGHYGGPFALP